MRMKCLAFWDKKPVFKRKKWVRSNIVTMESVFIVKNVRNGLGNNMRKTGEMIVIISK